jgi:hypothetical protein
LEFILTGFHQDANMRHYAFQGISSDRSRSEYVVGADLQLIRKYQIAVQELPLLCRRLLEEHMTNDPQANVCFTEEDMQTFAKNRAEAKAEAAHRKKLPRRPPANNSGRAWRAPGQH